MKRLVFAVSVLAAVVSVADAVKSEITPEERARRKQQRVENYRAKVEKEGGIVKGAIPGKIIHVVNAQSDVSEADVESIVQAMRDTLRVPVEIVKESMETGCPLAVAEKGFEGGNTAGVVAIVAAEKAPTLSVMPEDFTAIVNVTKLKSDSPDAEKLALRVRKEVWRGFGYAMGAAYSGYQPCVMRKVGSLEELDDKPIAILSPEPLMRIEPALRQMGLGQLRSATYKRACEEGWAPAPTNEWQKAVWETVKAEQSEKPTKGLRIKYNPNKSAK